MTAMADLAWQNSCRQCDSLHYKEWFLHTVISLHSSCLITPVKPGKTLQSPNQHGNYTGNANGFEDAFQCVMQ